MIRFSKGISISFAGEAKTEWLKTKFRKFSRKSVRYTGQEICLNAKYYLLGSQSGPEINLPSGVHSFPFVKVLPQDLPSTFHGSYGSVRYTIKITIDRPKEINQDITIEFNVISRLDLNQNPELKVNITNLSNG